MRPEKNTMNETMTSKERWLAAIHMKPIDRLPFWPKLNDAYPKAQASPFKDMNLDSIHNWIGSDKHKDITPCIRETRKNTSVKTTQTDDTMTTIYRTPHGQMRFVQKFDEPSNAWHPTVFPVQSLPDIKIMTEIFEDITVEMDHHGLEKAKKQNKEISHDALTADYIGESALMYWVEWLAGCELAHYLLIDHQQEVEALFKAIHNVLKRKTELLCEYSEADVLYLIENTSTTLISPEQYQRYCAHHVSECANITSSANRNLILHMCGHIKALLPDLAKIPAQAFEAFTSPTLGNTTLLDGRTQCPDKCLIGGTNAMLWTRSADQIISQIETDLNALPHHRGIVVTSGGVMPPMCKPDTIKRVCDWVKNYPVKMNEIS